jgi:hypothetical protein
LTGKVVSEIFFCLAELFKFSGADTGIKTRTSNRGRARVFEINWEEVSKYLKAIEAVEDTSFEVRDQNEDVSMEDCTPTSSASGVRPSRRILLQDDQTQEQPKQEPPTNEAKVSASEETPETEYQGERRNANLRFFPQVFQKHLMAKCPLGSPLENLTVVLKSTKSSGGYQEVVNGQVQLYTGERIPYYDLLWMRIVKYLEILNIDAKCLLPCPYITTGRCARLGPHPGSACYDKEHFVKLYNSVSDITYGDCSFLNDCYNLSTCVYLHYGTTGCIKPPTFFDKIRLPDEVKMPLLEHGSGDLRKGLEILQTNVKAIRVSEKLPSSYVRQL